VVDSETARLCFLPQVVRVAVASQQHYGVSMTRGEDGQDPKLIPAEQWPATAAPKPPFSKLLAADPDDAGALVGRAAVFENHKLLANAWPTIRRWRPWKDAVWIKGKIFELSETLASADAAQRGHAAGGKVYALLIGVSKYQRLPKDQWLQFRRGGRAHHVENTSSAREAGLPPDQVLRLTDEKATTAAMQCVPDVPQGPREQRYRDDPDRRPRTVESPGSKSLHPHHDSDPQDGEHGVAHGRVQTLIDEELSKVGRVAVSSTSAAPETSARSRTRRSIQWLKSWAKRKVRFSASWLAVRRSYRLKGRSSAGATAHSATS
jgi:hypothetical protein